MDPEFPKISIITPSFNQAEFLERTICSVLEQGYPNLEYIVIDGGSVDGSVDIIRRYEKHLAYWVSEADNGQAHAINKGLAIATGEWVAWQNSDDVYYPDALKWIAEVVRRNPGVELIVGDMNLITKDGSIIRDVRYVRPTYGSLLAEGMVLANQAAFWRRSTHDKAGYLDETLDCVFDREWFLRILKMKIKVVHTSRILGALRLHEDTKTNTLAEVFHIEAARVLAGREPALWMKRFYQLRRFILMLGLGHHEYFLRGVRRRLKMSFSVRNDDEKK